jgi:hypothetical protein
VADLSPAEKKVFGEEAYIHPITNGIIEVGSGAFPAWRQALIHCDKIEAESGDELANDLRRRLLPEMPKQVAAQVRAKLGE